MELTCLTVNVDEIIIEFVKESACIYNKSDPDFKNITKKKNVWKNLCEELKAIYNVDMTADAIEKRWASLRDMFSREHRKQKLPPLGSGYTPTKEWELYKNMLFLVPHIAHRRTKTSFPLSNQLTTNLINSLPKDSNTSSCLSSDKLTLMNHSTCNNYSENVNFEDERSYLQTKAEEVDITSIEEDMISRPCSTLSNYSNSSSSSNSNMQISALNTIPSTSWNCNTNSINVKSPSLKFKTIKKIIPELDNFAKRKKSKDEQIDRELAQVNSVISAAMKSVTSLVSDEKENKDGYMLAIEEALKYVPGKNKTLCLIEVLQTIQRYEERTK